LPPHAQCPRTSPTTPAHVFARTRHIPLFPCRLHFLPAPARTPLLQLPRPPPPYDGHLFGCWGGSRGLAEWRVLSKPPRKPPLLTCHQLSYCAAQTDAPAGGVIEDFFPSL
jgi:hypothetical protein